MPRTLESLFDASILIRPADARPNLVHLIRAIATVCGVESIEANAATREITGLIGDADHLIFVLLDGLGMNVVNRLPQDSFVKSHVKCELTATCPSTTACALTTVATGEYPSRHGVVGWFTHVPELGLTATVLPFVERFTGEGLVRRGLTPGDVIPVPPLCPRMGRQVLTVVPEAIVNTPYNEWARGGTEGRGYRTIRHAVDQIVEHVSRARKPTYTHLYLPEIDTVCHKLGSEADGVVPEVMRIDAELSRMANELNGRARVVITADHGLIDVPPARQTLVTADDPLVETLKVPVSGDARMPIFHVREGRHADFRRLADERFGDRIAFVPTPEAERMELFGPGRIADGARGRLGDYVGFPFDRATLAYHPPNKPLGHLFKAVHAGLSPQEMWVPLSIA